MQLAVKLNIYGRQLLKLAKLMSDMSFFNQYLINILITSASLMGMPFIQDLSLVQTT